MHATCYPTHAHQMQEFVRNPGYLYFWETIPLDMLGGGDGTQATGEGMAYLDKSVIALTGQTLC